MKAVVLEIKDGMCAVMKEDGTVVKIKRECEVGDVIELTEKADVVSFPKASRMRRLRAVAAALVAAFVLFAGVFYYTGTVKACSFVSMDVNPSLEYILNAKDRVISVRAWNEDAEPIVDFLNGEGKIKGKLIDEAVSDTTRYLRELGYLGKEEKEDNILVSVSTSDKTVSDRLVNAVRTAIETVEEKPVRLEVKEATLEEHAQAEQYGISTGRYVKAVEGKEREADASGNMAASVEKGAVLTPQDLEKAKKESVESLISQDKKVTAASNQKEETALPVARPNPEPAVKPEKDADKEDKKDKEDKDDKKEEKKDEPEIVVAAVSDEEEKSTEAAETETDSQKETGSQGTQEETPAEGSTENTDAEASEEPSTESTEPDVTDEERAAAEAEAVRQQQEQEAAEAEAEAEAVRQQQEIAAAEAEAEAEAVRQQQEQEAAEGVASVPGITGSGASASAGN